LRIGKRAKSEFASGAQPFPSFADQCEPGFEFVAIGPGVEGLEVAASWGTGSSLPQKFAEVVEFEDV
jgi:hypothetical protein